MRREQLTEKILDIKRKRGWSWRYVAGEIAACHQSSWSAPFSAR
jgi:hypothetical protein